jgi:transcriptional regulator with XRE-family HTH domain
MTPLAFKHWRKQLNLSQKEAAEALGLKRRVVQYYEKGERDGEKVTIPKAVRLACWALAQGVDDFRGLEGGGKGVTRAKDDNKPRRQADPVDEVDDTDDGEDDDGEEEDGENGDQKDA